MESVVITIHSTDLIGTCDKSGECGTLSNQLQELEDMGVDPGVTEIIAEHRREVCASVGRCSLYYGIQEKED